MSIDLHQVHSEGSFWRLRERESQTKIKRLREIERGRDRDRDRESKIDEKQKGTKSMTEKVLNPRISRDVHANIKISPHLQMFYCLHMDLEAQLQSAQKNIANHQIRNSQGAIQLSIFQYCDSNIRLFSIVKLSLFLCFICGISYLPLFLIAVSLKLSLFLALRGDSEKFSLLYKERKRATTIAVAKV